MTEQSKTSLKDLVKKESASSEETKQNEIAALRQKIEADKQEIERLKRNNNTKKVWIIVLGCIIVIGAGVAVYYYYMSRNSSSIMPITQTTTETLSESVTQDEQEQTQNKEIENPNAQYEMAKHYLNGTNGVAIDKDKAVYWLTKSADNGNTAAMITLGNMYEIGDAVEKSNKTAFRYYFTASRSEDKQALYKVGKFYYYGMGVDKNIEKATFYLRKSAQEDYQPAKALLDLIKKENVAEHEQHKLPLLIEKTQNDDKQKSDTSKQIIE